MGSRLRFALLALGVSAFCLSSVEKGQQLVSRSFGTVLVDVGNLGRLVWDVSSHARIQIHNWQIRTSICAVIPVAYIQIESSAAFSVMALRFEIRTTHAVHTKAGHALNLIKLQPIGRKSLHILPQFANKSKGRTIKWATVKHSN